MTPGRVRRESLSVLRAARREMLQSTWAGALRRADRATRRRAAAALLNIQAAIDTIEQAELEAIRSAMAGKKAEVARGITRLEDAIGNMRRVRTVLSATEELLRLAARIAPLLI